jgi:cysteine desulfurase
MAPAKHLQQEGWDITVVQVDRLGRVSPDDIARALRPDTALVSVMHANNEVGAVQPIEEIARITRRSGALLHTDAAQTAGKIAVDVNVLGVDLLSLAGHKFYATKGVGTLYVRQNTPLLSIAFGAEHERGLRPGTENVPAIVGFGVAAGLARERLPMR